MPVRAVVVAWVAAAGTSAPCQPEAGIRSPADREHGMAAIGMAAIGTTGAAIGVIIIIIIIMTSSSSAASAFRSGAGDILTAMAMATHTDMATVTATHTDTDTIITITATRVTDMATAVATGVSLRLLRCSANWLRRATTTVLSMESWDHKRDARFARTNAAASTA